MASKIISVSFPTPAHAKAAFAALEPETGSAYERKASTVLTVKNNRVQATIHASHPQGMRASEHTYTALLHFVKRLEK